MLSCQICIPLKSNVVYLSIGNKFWENNEESHFLFYLFPLYLIFFSYYNILFGLFSTMLVET